MIHESDDFLQRLIAGDPSLGLIATAPAQHRKRFATALLMEREAAQEAGMLALSSAPSGAMQSPISTATHQ